MNWLTILLFILWVYLLTVLKRGRLDFWYFCVGSIGMFLFMMIWLQPMITIPLTRMVAVVAGVIGKVTDTFESYFHYGILFIDRGKEYISLFIDYECSGVIEIFAFSSMLWFFPVYRLHEKVVVNIAGILFIFAANVLRILVICFMVHIGGNDMFYIAHTIFGRVVFYFLSAGLYFYVFTKAQIVRQKVGNFRYESD